jgi:hypothetical protein
MLKTTALVSLSFSSDIPPRMRGERSPRILLLDLAAGAPGARRRKLNRQACRDEAGRHRSREITSRSIDLAGSRKWPLVVLTLAANLPAFSVCLKRLL